MARVFYFTGLIRKDDIENPKNIYVHNDVEYYPVGVVVREVSDSNKPPVTIVRNYITKQERKLSKDKIPSEVYCVPKLKVVFSENKNRESIYRVSPKDEVKTKGITDIINEIDDENPFGI